MLVSLTSVKSVIITLGKVVKKEAILYIKLPGLVTLELIYRTIMARQKHTKLDKC